MKISLLAVTLSALLIIGFGLSQSSITVDAYTSHPSVAPQGVIFRYKAAGLQFNVPVGWEIEALSDRVKISKQEGEDRFRMASISPLDSAPANVTLDAQFKAVWEGVAAGPLKDTKDFKKASEPEKGTTGDGMPLISQAFTSTLQGVQMVGLVVLIKAAKPTVIFVYGTANNSAQSDKDFDNLMRSIKKIE